MKLTLASLSILSMALGAWARPPASGPYGDAGTTVGGEPSDTIPVTVDFKPVPQGSTNVRYYHIQQNGTLRIYTRPDGVKSLSYVSANYMPRTWQLGDNQSHAWLWVSLNAADEIPCGKRPRAPGNDHLYSACEYFSDPRHFDDYRFVDGNAKNSHPVGPFTSFSRT
ncbi:uncharacterized protein PFL1_02410 [Pseudozyma flocculosa PF-1]|uniref:uncharacterized protein n=1 Tax=Pseudozyma flocculosa PF-1 TaxID=1277687 RepID=UPI00045617F9|nr:uncharacterized protein PFL1_02410 [Pseudozyma flocculosa PF-1]EPQ30294.1 hypothetical protein PFL1_02410 [Pseudozyma flocculosa PF-1]